MSSDDRTGRVQLDAHLEDALRTLMRLGMPSRPTLLALGQVSWGGVADPGVDQVNITEEGYLVYEGQPPAKSAIVDDPESWTEEKFAGEAIGRGPLIITQGLSNIANLHFDSNGHTITAALHGFSWHIEDANAKLWVSRLTFRGAKPPVVLWWPECNFRTAVGGRDYRGWRFDTSDGLVFLVEYGDEQWAIAFEAKSGARPDTRRVTLALSAIGYALGEQLQVGVFYSIQDYAIGCGLARMTLAQLNPVRETRQAPALPATISAFWLTAFIEKVMKFCHAEPESPMLGALQMYFASIDGYVDTQFLHAWIATESLAHWAIENRRLRDGGELRLADHSAWLEWVMQHEADIRAHALPGRGDSLVDRVRGSEIDRPTIVQRLFLGEDLEWTEEMGWAEKTRHGVAHRGSMIGRGSRNWHRDLSRVGLAKTMLTAMIAKLINYDGPIADRAETHNDTMSHALPDWWERHRILSRYRLVKDARYEIAPDEWRQEQPTSFDSASFVMWLLASLNAWPDTQRDANHPATVDRLVKLKQVDQGELRVGDVLIYQEDALHPEGDSQQVARFHAMVYIGHGDAMGACDEHGHLVIRPIEYSKRWKLISVHRAHSG